MFIWVNLFGGSLSSLGMSVIHKRSDMFNIILLRKRPFVKSVTSFRLNSPHYCMDFNPQLVWCSSLFVLVIWQVVGVLVALKQVGVAGLISSCERLHSTRIEITRSWLKCQQQSEYYCHSDVAKDTCTSNHSHQCKLETKHQLSFN